MTISFWVLAVAAFMCPAHARNGTTLIMLHRTGLQLAIALGLWTLTRECLTCKLWRRPRSVKLRAQPVRGEVLTVPNARVANDQCDHHTHTLFLPHASTHPSFLTMLNYANFACNPPKAYHWVGGGGPVRPETWPIHSCTEQIQNLCCAC